jgi:hypothetical protein
MAQRAGGWAFRGRALVTLVFAVLCGCSSQHHTPPPSASPVSPAIRQAEQLLTRYGLTPSGTWTWTQGVLDNSPNRIPNYFPDFVHASKSVGLDLRPYAGKRVQYLSVTLQGHDQAWNGSNAPTPSPTSTGKNYPPSWFGEIDATFVVADGRVVGAYMSLGGYVGGPSSLKDHYGFMPAGLTPEHLDFTGLKRVDICGPWAHGNWQNPTRLSDSETQRLLSLIAASSLRNGAPKWAGPSDGDYPINFTFSNGAVVMARLVTMHDSGDTYLSFSAGPFDHVHYVPPAELKPYVESLLGI